MANSLLVLILSLQRASNHVVKSSVGKCGLHYKSMSCLCVCVQDFLRIKTALLVIVRDKHISEFGFCTKHSQYREHTWQVPAMVHLVLLQSFQHLGLIVHTITSSSQLFSWMFWRDPFRIVPGILYNIYLGLRSKFASSAATFKIPPLPSTDRVSLMAL